MRTTWKEARHGLKIKDRNTGEAASHLVWLQAPVHMEPLRASSTLWYLTFRTSRPHIEKAHLCVVLVVFAYISRVFLKKFLKLIF